MLQTSTQWHVCHSKLSHFVGSSQYLTKRVGWRTFRHTYSTLLRNGEDIKVVQELLRHANSRITMDVYTQALSPAKREAQGRVAETIFPKRGESKFLLDSCAKTQFPVSRCKEWRGRRDSNPRPLP